MLLKTILLVALFLSFGEARDVELIPLKGKDVAGVYADGTMDILLKYHEGSSDDWIGIYKEGASNKWENIVAWKWVKDMSSGFACPTQACDESYPRFLRVQLEDGDYEARFFRNNSFILDQKLNFTVKAIDSFVTGISQTYDAYLNKLDIQILGTSSNATATPEDWIGLYKVGTSNNFDNVLKWAWIGDDLFKIGKDSWDLKSINLETGDYEIRYFLRNSFITHKKTTPFHFIKNNPNPVMKNVLMQTAQLYFSFVDFKNASGKKTDWYGVFKEGDERKSTNLRAWGYNSDGKTEGTLKLKETEFGRYTVVWFKENSYQVLAESKLILIRDF